MREIETAKTEILKEFLHKAKQIQEGIDRDGFICFEEDQKKVKELLAYLRGMEENEEAITSWFESIQSEEFFWILLNYEEYKEMEWMKDAFNAIERAKEELEKNWKV